jgi:soluble lytic murein transglycosylase-like protein
MDVVKRGRRCRILAVSMLLSLIPIAAHAQRGCGTQRWQSYIAEAAERFLVPSNWIDAVIRVESAGCAWVDDRPITSAAGAIGLMQLMPTTWGRLRQELGLGIHSDDPRDNILAGTAYLRELYERFGSPGFLAAYHAGPLRYRDYVEGRNSLPRGTWEYIARVRQLAYASTRPLRSDSRGTDSIHAATALSGRITPKARDVTADPSSENTRRDALFVVENVAPRTKKAAR